MSPSSGYLLVFITVVCRHFTLVPNTVMDAGTKASLKLLKTLADEHVLSAIDFKHEKAKALGQDGSRHQLSSEVIHELRELKTFYDDEILDEEEYTAQKRVLLDKSIQILTPANLVAHKEVAEDADEPESPPPLSKFKHILFATHHATHLVVHCILP